jgi:hypothetical protein
MDTFEPEASEADPEQRPLVPTTMLADIEPAPSFETDSFAQDISFMSSGAELRFGQTLSMSRGGGFSGGFAGGASGGGPGIGSVPSDVEDLLTHDSDREAQSEPTLPETSAPKGSDEEILVDLTNPSDPPAIQPYDLIAPISGGSGGEESKPHVSVPEPSTWGLFGIALLGAAIGRRRRPGVSRV